MRLVYLFALAFLVSNVKSVDDKQCGTNFDRLWLDIIFIVDNSYLSNTSFIYDKIDSFFTVDMQIGTAYDDPRSTRIAIIVSGIEATVQVELNTLQSRSDLTNQLARLRNIPVAQTSGQYIDDPLNITLHMLSNTQGFRDNYKKMIVIFSGSFGGDPFPYTDQLLSSGFSVSTVNMYGRGLETTMKRMSSPGMAFGASDRNLTQEMRHAMLQTNCHCPNSTTQYVIPTANVPRVYAVCVDSGYYRQSWHAGQASCHTQGKYLTTEFTKEKRQFNMNFMNKRQQENAYFNGLFAQNGTWFWDQPVGNASLPLEPSSGSVSSRSGCIADMKYSDGTVSWTPISCANSFPAICEMIACDTDNYCDQ